MINKNLNNSIILSLLVDNDKITNDLIKKIIKEINLCNENIEDILAKYFEIYFLNSFYILVKKGLIELNFNKIDFTKILRLFVNYSVYEEMLLSD